MTSLLIDLGGTNIKYAVYSDEKLQNKNTIPTDASKGYNEVLGKIFWIVEQFKNIDLVSISQAGIIKSDSSVFYANSGLPGFIGKSLKKEIEGKYGIKTFCINDAKAAATFIAKNDGIDEALVMVVGTGVGSAIIHKNNVFMSKDGITGEIGNIKIGDTNIDKLLSLTQLSNICKLINSQFDFSDSKTFKGLEEHIDMYFDNLSKWIFNFVMGFGFTNVILGGSLPKFGEYALNEINKRLTHYPSEIVENIKIGFAKLGEDANLLGAYYSAIERLKNE